MRHSQKKTDEWMITYRSAKTLLIRCRRRVSYLEAEERLANLINLLNRQFSPKARTRCALYHAIIGSTTGKEHSPDIDLPGNPIQNFLQQWARELGITPLRK